MAKCTTNQETCILGPGSAPPGQYWVIDGIADGSAQGTVYKITFSYDSDTRKKLVSWAPTVDQEMLELAGDSAASIFKHYYAISSSWHRWTPFAMTPVPGQPGTFETVTTIGITGNEQFQFLRDGQKTEAIYPALKATASTTPVRGPDMYGEKKYFKVVGKTGDIVTIRLKVWEGDISV